MIIQKRYIKLTNTIAAISLTILIYWIVINTVVNFYNLRIFGKDISNLFTISLWSLLAIMFASLVVNIMFNLTIIANRLNHEKINTLSAKKSWLKWILILSVPIIIGLLFIGDQVVSNKMKNVLVNQSKTIISESTDQINELISYEYDQEWLVETNNNLNFILKMNPDLDKISTIVQDKIKGKNILLEFDHYNQRQNDLIPDKSNYLFSPSIKETKALNGMFNEKQISPMFFDVEKEYRVFHPVYSEDKVIIVCLIKRKHKGYYGK